MKKIIISILSLVLLFSFVGCAEKEDVLTKEEKTKLIEELNVATTKGLTDEDLSSGLKISEDIKYSKNGTEVATSSLMYFSGTGEQIKMLIRVPGSSTVFILDNFLYVDYSATLKTKTPVETNGLALYIDTIKNRYTSYLSIDFTILETIDVKVSGKEGSERTIKYTYETKASDVGEDKTKESLTIDIVIVLNKNNTLKSMTSTYKNANFSKVTFVGFTDETITFPSTEGFIET